MHSPLVVKFFVKVNFALRPLKLRRHVAPLQVKLLPILVQDINLFWHFLNGRLLEHSIELLLLMLPDLFCLQPDLNFIFHLHCMIISPSSSAQKLYDLVVTTLTKESFRCLSWWAQILKELIAAFL